LIEEGADVHAKDNDNNTPMDYITSYGKDENRIAKALIKAGADPVAKNS
jgi:ankyrin repeat protein